MKEEELLGIIKSIVGDKYIGDDCAYLEEFGIVITQDNLVESVHFDRSYTTPFKLGYKSAMVNISDIVASGAEPKYMTVGLSLPKDIQSDFVKEFYEGMQSALVGVEIIGGDITSSDKIVISITAIGSTKGRKISSRKNAKVGDVIVVSGEHGASAGGLKLLQQGKVEPTSLIDAHLMPKAEVEFAKSISKNIQRDYAMMDSSDGLADALIKIANASDKTLVVDFDKVLYDDELAKLFPDEYIDMVLYGGEDYKIVGVLPKDFAQNLANLTIIGVVEERQEGIPVRLKLNEQEFVLDSEKCFNHFSA
jgi:thiamine-monophosphate kinase